MSMRYMRMKLHDGRVLNLHVLEETTTFYLGRAVNMKGDDKSYKNADGAMVDLQEMIFKGAIKWEKPLHYNRHYDELEIRKGTKP